MNSVKRMKVAAIPRRFTPTYSTRARQVFRFLQRTLLNYWRQILVLSLWVSTLYALGGKLGILFICLTFFVLALCSSKRGRSSFSGFSVLNHNFATAAGQLTAADWDAAYRGGGIAQAGGGVGEESTRAAVNAAVADANEAAVQHVRGTPLGTAAKDTLEGTPTALLSQLAAERSARIKKLESM
jgi:hypothetical protein